MVVTIDPSDLRPISAFPFAWRITDERWTKLPSEELREIAFLSDEASVRVFQRFEQFPTIGMAFDAQKYHVVSDCRLDDTSKQAVQEWFASLPIRPSEQVYVSWCGNPPAVAVMPWSIFTRRYDDFWYPFDRLAVYDDTLEWAVLLGPEERAIFILRGGVAPETPESDPSRGLCLFYRGRMFSERSANEREKEVL